jgi:hypothetical protein
VTTSAAEQLSTQSETMKSVELRLSRVVGCQ